MEDLSMETMEAEPQPARPRASFNLFNLLAVLFLALSCLSALCIGTALVVPGVVPEAFRPPTVPAIALIPTLPSKPTSTNTAIAPTLPPEWTATNTPTITNTPPPSGTPTETPTPTPPTPINTIPHTPTHTSTPTRTRVPTATGPTPTPTRTRSPFAYTPQNGSPTFLANFANTAGCKWQGIAGQVFDLSGRPQIGLLAHLEGGGLTLDALTGSKPEYGQSGYEFFLTDTPRDTTNEFRVQLRNTAGAPLSDVITVPTFASCVRNLTLLNFVQNH